MGFIRWRNWDWPSECEKAASQRPPRSLLHGPVFLNQKAGALSFPPAGGWAEIGRAETENRRGATSGVRFPVNIHRSIRMSWRGGGADACR